MIIITILITFFSIISLLVLHEFGHFIVAKKFGVKVDEFGIGYPPRLFGKKIGETLYSVNLLPFGAFVKIPGEGGEKSNLEDYRVFTGKPVWQRFLIIVGGVVSFWLVAAILLSIVFSMGTSQAISDEETGNLVNAKVQILAVYPNTPAEEAGIKAGDSIKQFSFAGDGTQFSIEKVKEIQELTEKYKGQEVILTIQRGEKIFDVSLIPRESPPKDEGPMGITLIRTAEKSYSWWLSPVKGVEATINLTAAVIMGWGNIIGNLIQGEGLPKGVQLLGPIGIGAVVYQAAQVGINYFLQFIAMIAVYLAIFNILPIPALDGGKLVFLVIEKVKGSPVNQKIEQNITAAFFTLLILLMIWVTIQDITRLF